MSASRSASSSEAEPVAVEGADTRGTAGPARCRDRSDRRRSRVSSTVASGKHSSKSDAKTARSSGRLMSVACIAVRNASRSSRSTWRIAAAASSTSPSDTSTPPSLSPANRRSSIARMASPAECHRLLSRTLIAATVSSSASRIGPRSSSRLTRPACVDTLIAAIARPDRSRSGAAIERTPSSSSWSTSAHPWSRTSPDDVGRGDRDRPRSARCASVDRHRRRGAGRSSSSGRSARSTRPIDVIAAGSRDPSESAIVMMRFVGTRAM